MGLKPDEQGCDHSQTILHENVPNFFTQNASLSIQNKIAKENFHLLWEMLFSIFRIAKVGCLLNSVPKIICEMGCLKFSHNIDHIGGLHQFVFEFLSVFIIFY